MTMNKKLIKRIVVVVLLLIVGGGAIGTYMWFKPHPKVEDAKGIDFTSYAPAGSSPQQHLAFVIVRFGVPIGN